MNNDLISRDALKKALTNAHINMALTFDISSFNYVMNTIDNAPTVEPTFGLFKEMLCAECEKRPQGEWIRTGSLGNENAHYECSNCHHGDEHAESQEVPYCWFCGAKMKKGSKE